MSTTADAPTTRRAATHAERAGTGRSGDRMHRRSPGRAGLDASALLFFTPVPWMVLTSLHSEPDAATNPPSFFAPLTLDGYADVLRRTTGASPWPSLINSADGQHPVHDPGAAAGHPGGVRAVDPAGEKWTDVMFFFLSTKMLPVVAGLLPIYLFAQARRAARQHLHPGHPLHLDEPADRGVDDALVPRRGAGARCSRPPSSTAPA